MARCAVNRADLLRAWAALPDGDPVRLAAAAGFVQDDRPQATVQLAMPEPPTRREMSAEPAASLARPPLQARLPLITRLWDREQPSQAGSPLVAQRSPFTLADCAPRASLDSVPWSPLVPDQRLWPALRSSVSRPHQAGLDLRACLRQLSAGQSLRRLPRRVHQRLPSSLHIVWDVSDAMRPYQRDFDRIVALLARLRGRAAVCIQQVDGLPGRYPAWADPPAPQASRSLSQADAVLVLSDLGHLAAHPGPALRWQAWAHQMAQRGLPVTAWLPIGPAWVSSAAASLLRVHCLAGAAVSHALAPARAAAQVGGAWRALHPAVGSMLSLAACAIRLEPELLRLLRRLLPALRTEPALEALAWTAQPTVGSAAASRPLTGPEQAEYRRHFGQLDSGLQVQVLQAMRAVHASQGRSTETLETLVWASHSRPEAKALAGNAAVAEARQWMQRWLQSSADLSQAVTHSQDFARDLLRRNAHDAQFHQSNNDWLGDTWALSGETVVPDGLDADQALAARQARQTDQPLGVAQVMLHEGAVWLYGPGARTPLHGAVLLATVTARGDVGVQQGPRGRHHAVPMAAERTSLGHLAGGHWPLRLTGLNSVLEIDAQARPAWSTRWGHDARGLFADLDCAGITQRMRYLRPGQFLMGTPEEEAGGYGDERPGHPVTLTQGLWLADTPCTQALWQAVMGDNPSHFKDRPGAAERPVEEVSWQDVQVFLGRLKALLPEGLEPVLPTEAEWEYACRAGSVTAYAWGEAFDPERANVDHGKGALNETSSVKRYAPNAWGLYDMHGNVWEWCADGKRDYDQNAQADPWGPEGPQDPRVLRGGSWDARPARARSAFRLLAPPGGRDRDVGFRLALRSPSPGPGGPAGAPGAQAGGRRPSAAAAEPARPTTAQKKRPRRK